MATKLLVVLVFVGSLIFICSGHWSGKMYELSDDEQVEFSDMSTYIATTSLVFHIESDNYSPGRLLYSDLHSLWNTNGVTKKRIVGSTSAGHINGNGILARFNLIKNFAQMSNPRDVLIVDYSNHCLRLYNRDTEIVSDFVGKCVVSGFRDDRAKQAKFNNPSSVLQDRRNSSKYFIADRSNNAIRVMDIISKNVTTLVPSGSLYRPREIIWDKSTDDSLIIIGTHSINRLSLSSLSLTSISGHPYVGGFADGTLSQAKYSFTREIVQIQQHLFIVTDNGNNKLRFVDLLNNKVTSICDLSTIANCNSSQPSAIYLLNNTLYIGVEREIKALTVSIRTSATTTTQLSSTTDLSTKTSSTTGRSFSTSSSTRPSSTTPTFSTIQPGLGTGKPETETTEKIVSTKSKQPTTKTSPAAGRQEPQGQGISPEWLGLIIGGILGVILIAALVIFLYQKNKMKTMERVDRMDRMDMVLMRAKSSHNERRDNSYRAPPRMPPPVYEIPPPVYELPREHYEIPREKSFDQDHEYAEIGQFGVSPSYNSLENYGYVEMSKNGKISNNFQRY